MQRDLYIWLFTIIISIMVLPSAVLAAKENSSQGQIYTIQTSSHKKLLYAQHEAAILHRVGYRSIILGVYDRSNKLWYVVHAGPFANLKSAKINAAALSKKIGKKLSANSINQDTFNKYLNRVQENPNSRPLLLPETTKIPALKSKQTTVKTITTQSTKPATTYSPLHKRTITFKTTRGGTQQPRAVEKSSQKHEQTIVLKLAHVIKLTPEPA
ncbi:MAG: SPOR domain-containing protein, partial [Magnetococcales bacterium]|nr:SPOR domain-containing protein [Magnetococcales bacterium]